VRNQSVSDLRSSGLGRSDSRRNGSIRGGASAGTFAPQFIKPENMDGTNGDVRVVEGENDLSGKRYIWMRDDEKAFVKGWVLEELPDGMLRAQCEDGSVSSGPQAFTERLS
jgi:myosin protein heavy chain